MDTVPFLDVPHRCLDHTHTGCLSNHVPLLPTSILAELQTGKPQVSVDSRALILPVHSNKIPTCVFYWRSVRGGGRAMGGRSHIITSKWRVKISTSSLLGRLAPSGCCSGATQEEKLEIPSARKRKSADSEVFGWNNARDFKNYYENLGEFWEILDEKSGFFLSFWRKFAEIPEKSRLQD